ncbi:MAG: O-antigen ligase family protein [Lachnospiraceae bacterium]
MIYFTKGKLQYNRSSNILELFLYLYILLLFLLPGDVFQKTAIFTFEKNWTTYFEGYNAITIYVSVLYFPIMIYAFPYLYKNKISRILMVLLAVLAIKDVTILTASNSHTFQLDMYFVFFTSICLCIVINNCLRTKNDINQFMLILLFFTVSTLILSLVTGMGTSGNGFENRYHATGLASGETAYLLGMLSCYFFYYSNLEYGKYLGVFCIPCIVLTGSRKEVLYIFFIYLIYKMANLLKGKKILHRLKITKQAFISIFLIAFFLLTFALLANNIIEKIDINRYVEVFAGLFSNGVNSLLLDKSGSGRMESILVGINVIKQYPIGGCCFSFFDVQLHMQIVGYPTFPHNSIIYYTCAMGIPIALIFIYYIIKVTIKVKKNNSPLVYILIYFFLNNFISGGANLAIKVVFMNIFLFFVIVKDLNLEKIKNIEIR